MALNDKDVRVVLVRPRNPLNIGAAARAMANFGFDDLVVVAPYEPTWQESKAAVGAEDLLVPVGALGVDDNGLSVGRDFHFLEVDNVEELVECELGFVLRPEHEGTSQDDHNSDGSFLDSHWVPGGKKGYTTPESSKASMRVADLELQVHRAVMLNSDPALPGAKPEIENPRRAIPIARMEKPLQCETEE